MEKNILRENLGEQTYSSLKTTEKKEASPITEYTLPSQDRPKAQTLTIAEILTIETPTRSLFKPLLREIEILKQSYLNKRSTFTLHNDEVKSESAKDFITRMDICLARILVEYEELQKHLK